MAKVTLKQIAERAGVSINTVSLALRDMPNVNPDTRARICGIAAELGYYAHKSHRTPSKKLGLISTGSTSEGFLLLCGVPEAVSGDGI